MRPRFRLLTTVGLLLAALMALLAASLQTIEVGAAVAIAYQVPGLAMIGAAVVVHRRFELAATGFLLGTAGGVWFVGNLAFQQDHPLLRDLGVLSLGLPTAMLLHMALALPSGHLRHRWERVTVIAIYMLQGPVYVLQTLWSPFQGVCDGCAPPVLRIDDHPGYSGVLLAVTSIGGAAAALAVAVLMVDRFRREGGAGRRLLRPVFAGAALSAVVNLAGALQPRDGYVPDLQFTPAHRADDAVAAAYLITYAVIALAFPLGAWLSSRAAGVFGRLVPRLASEPTSDQLESLLTSALGDPTVRVDLDPPAIPEPPAPHRAHADVTFGGTLLARLDHASPLLTDRESFETVLGTLGLLLGRRRLRADVGLESDDPLEAAIEHSRGSRREEALASELKSLRDAFISYVGADLSDRVVREGVQLEGTTVDATIMFLDLRNFTTYAENRSPADVVKLLNSFWELVVPIVVHHHGHANRFIGDGLLAVFGTPQPLPDHADHAIGCARKIVDSVERTYRGSVEVGIGLNSGLVSAGTIGGGGRYEFTVIGDVVNTAARVESATRATGDVVLLTEETKRRARLPHRFVSRHPQPLKGKADTVALFTIAD